MDWKELETAITEYGKLGENRESDVRYSVALSKLRWDHPEENMTHNADVLINYLATYKSYRHTIDEERLADMWLESVESLSAELEDISLERLDVLETVDREEDNLFCVGDVISRVYEEVRDIPGVGPANALRLLHLRFPKLFLMTDVSVRKYWEGSPLPEIYGMSKGRLFEPYGYAFIFLPAMSIQAVDAIMSCSLDEEINIEQAIENLQRLGGKSRSIARLIDIYYYYSASLP